MSTINNCGETATINHNFKKERGVRWRGCTNDSYWAEMSVSQLENPVHFLNEEDVN